jgi:hypothetical protein
MAPQTGLDDVEKRKISPLPGFEIRTLYRPARRQLLYRLRYLGSMTTDGWTNKFQGIPEKGEYGKKHRHAGSMVLTKAFFIYSK